MKGGGIAGAQSVKLYLGGWCMYNSPFDVLRLILSNLYYTMPFVYVINFGLVKGEERGQRGGGGRSSLSSFKENTVQHTMYMFLNER